MPKDKFMAQLAPKEIVAELDRFVIGPGRSQKGRGHRIEKPLEKAAGSRGTAGRDSAQKYHHDRSHGRGQKRKSPDDWRAWLNPPS